MFQKWFVMSVHCCNITMYKSELNDLRNTQRYWWSHRKKLKNCIQKSSFLMAKTAFGHFPFHTVWGWEGVRIVGLSTKGRSVQAFIRSKLCPDPWKLGLKACLHRGWGPQIGEAPCRGSPHLSCKRDQMKMKDYSGTWLIRTPRGHAIVSLLSGCSY